MHMYKAFLLLFALLIVSCTPEKQWTERTLEDSLRIIEVSGGPALGYSTSSGIGILERDGLPFKDLNKNGELEVYEDWRQPVRDRARDLASRLSLEEIAGLMLYSRHQAIPADSEGYRAGTYNGKPFQQADTVPFALTDQQRKFLTEDHLRHVLLTSVENPEGGARWNNNVQSLA